MLGLILIQSVWHSDGIPKRNVLKEIDFENNSKKQQQQKQQTTKKYHKISRRGGGCKELILFYQFILLKNKVSGLRNYTGCAELSTRRQSIASSHYPFTVLVRRLILD